VLLFSERADGFRAPHVLLFFFSSDVAGTTKMLEMREVLVAERLVGFVVNINGLIGTALGPEVAFAPTRRSLPDFSPLGFPDFTLDVLLVELGEVGVITKECPLSHRPSP